MGLDEDKEEIQKESGVMASQPRESRTAGRTGHDLAAFTEEE